MVCHTLRYALLVGAITAVAVSPAWAQHRHRSASCCETASSCCESSSCAPTAPAYRTITVTECVPETYTTKRTSYRHECRTEEYDTCRTECVPECRERVVCCVKRVPVVTTECRKVCRTVTSCEERTVMKTCYKYVNETICEKKCVSRGHWECREVPKCNLFGGGMFGGHGKHGGGDCCDPCATQCTPTRTKKVWVSCPEYVECPRTVCRKVCVQVPECVKVPVCRTVWEEVQVQVCSYRCVEEKRVEKYTCMVSRQVPCKATRTVRVCVPYEETVTCCRMVPRTVTRQVPVNDCCNASSSCCESSSGYSGGHGGGGFLRGHRGGCCR